MKQIERIQKMEERFNHASAAVKQLSEAVEEYAEAQSALNELSDYLSSKEWKKDFAADEKGMLPPDLKRGVLSEDAIFNLLEDSRNLNRRLAEVINSLS